MNKFKLIYADPPWQYGNTIANGAAGNHYKTMSLTELKRLPVWDLADENSVLAMWYTGTHNEEARALAEAWGFTVRTMKGFTWVKFNHRAEQRINAALSDGLVFDFYDFLDLLNSESRMNGGNHTRANTEDVLIATCGTGLDRASASVKQVVYSCLGEHSEKPWEVRNRLEKLYGDVPRIELFARTSTVGWEIWGDQCESSVKMVPGHAHFPAGKISERNQAELPESRIWPLEVGLVFSRLDGAEDLEAAQQNKLKAHINQLWLERVPTSEIITVAGGLVSSMQGAVNA